MNKIRRTFIVGGVIAALCSVVMLTGCGKSKEEKAADAVNSVINNVVDSLKTSN